ncbi:MAG TPA: hypothetical protein VH741_05855 [Candidatus Limnocylindrales bacterium]
MTSFRESVLGAGRQLGLSGGIFGWGGKRGSAPTPFDAVDPARLAGPDGSHPLAAVTLDELVAPASDGLDGAITLDDPAAIRIGEGIAGRIELTARREIRARSASLRLVGGVLTEQRRSKEDRDSQGRVTRREEWVEVHGKLFEQLPFSAPALPLNLAAGERFEAPFLIPAPRLGPVTAHLGTAVLAWAVEARWDIALGGDQRLATLVKVGQNIDYLRSGAVRLEPGALFDAWTVGDGTIAVKPLPPIVAGAEIEVTVSWPGAGGGRGARLELQADVEAPNGLKGIVLASQAVDPAAFRSGTTLAIAIPADAPPTLAAEGVGVSYRLRALVDRQLRSDLAIERALAVM